VPELENPGEPPPLRPLAARPGTGADQRPVLTDQGEFHRD
jgi:hypothetical protein